MMTDWYERTIKALELNGKGERTQESYARFRNISGKERGQPSKIAISLFT